MLIVESMDADSETRRISPIALHGGDLGTGPYTDLLNGPMDHGAFIYIVPFVLYRMFRLVHLLHVFETIIDFLHDRRPGNGVSPVVYGLQSRPFPLSSAEHHRGDVGSSRRRHQAVHLVQKSSAQRRVQGTGS